MLSVPEFGRRPPRGLGRLPSVLLTVVEPTGRPIGGGVLPAAQNIYKGGVVCALWSGYVKTSL